jgi:hypothetical protein
LRQDLKKLLYEVAQQYGIEMANPIGMDSLQSYFKNLFVKLQKLGADYEPKVVILIDEYDAPFITVEDKAIQDANKEVVRALLTVIKAASDSGYLKLVFVTGVSAYCFRDLRSGPNNLTDITLDENFATIAGYTEEELFGKIATENTSQVESVFSNRFKEIIRSEESEDLDEQALSEAMLDLKKDIETWYNGYRFFPLDKPMFNSTNQSELNNAKHWQNIAIYNPQSVLRYLSSGTFEPYWMETGPTTFLARKANKIPVLDVNIYQPIRIDKTSLTTPQESNLDTASALFQGGYFTIKYYAEQRAIQETGRKKRRMEHSVLLDFPNKEVRDSFDKQLAKEFGQEFGGKFQEKMHAHADSLNESLRKQDMPQFITTLKACFSGIPHQLFMHNKENEGFYHASLHCLLHGMNIEPHSEMCTNQGRADVVIEKFPETFYIIELKHNQDATVAVKQIREKSYYGKYINQNKEIVIIGINFSSDENVRNIDHAVYEMYNASGDQIKALTDIY